MHIPAVEWRLYLSKKALFGGLLNHVMKKKIKLDFIFPKRVVHFKNTKDYWAPNYNKNQVKLSYHGVINPYVQDITKFVYRVSVWGADDLGMDRDFDNHLDAKKLFNKIDSLKYVNKDILLDLGLKYF